MKGTIIFLHKRLCRSSKEKFPHERRSREWGNFFLLRLLSLEWRNIIVPWMTNREFFPSPFFKMTGLTFLFSYWKLFRSATNPWKSSIWLTTESICMLASVFLSNMKMLIPVSREIGMGKIPHSSLMAHSIFPIQGLAVVVKKDFPIRGFAAHGKIFFHYSCCAFHGEI